MGILVAIAILSLLIFFHELGHFAAARFFGVHVEVFSIGFGKTLYSKMLGKTQWRISAIPLGGYVKMKGQNDADPTYTNDDKDSYTDKRPWQRIIILLAGPFANFLLAFILYFIIANLGIPKLLPYIGTVGKNTPAQHAGLQKHDKITKINGIAIQYWEEVGEQINQSNTETTLLIRRDHKTITLHLQPQIIEDKNIFGEHITRRIIGISPSGEKTKVYLNLLSGLDYAWEETKKASLLILRSVQKLLTGIVGVDKLGGVITIIDVTAEASHVGIVALLFFTALISVNLGVLNLLPIPALDGGHILFNLYEIITRNKPNQQTLYILTMAGWILLFSLMALGLYNDINRLMEK